MPCENPGIEIAHVFASKKDPKTMAGIALFQWKYFYDIP